MADLNKKNSSNISGNFYVDTSCIDCETCQWMAPEVFKEIGNQSIVFHQPSNQQEEIKALHALVSCPTSSIGLIEKSSEIIKAINDFPLLIENNVYHCGFHSEKSFGAASYFIQRPEGNILIDSPRFVASLVKKLEKMGGIKYMFLTHIDDVAEHEKFQKHFNCQRIMHKDDIRKNTKNVEIQLSGKETFIIDKEIIIIPVPGHTKGHCVLLYKNKFLFTGDHLAWSDTLKQLYAFKRACWYSWSELYKSMQKLSEYDFEWVLPQGCLML